MKLYFQFLPAPAPITVISTLCPPVLTGPSALRCCISKTTWDHGGVICIRTEWKRVSCFNYTFLKGSCILKYPRTKVTWGKRHTRVRLRSASGSSKPESAKVVLILTRQWPCRLINCMDHWLCDPLWIVVSKGAICGPGCPNFSLDWKDAGVVLTLSGLLLLLGAEEICMRVCRPLWGPFSSSVALLFKWESEQFL